MPWTQFQEAIVPHHEHEPRQTVILFINCPSNCHGVVHCIIKSVAEFCNRQQNWSMHLRPFLSFRMHDLKLNFNVRQRSFHIFASCHCEVAARTRREKGTAVIRTCMKVYTHTQKKSQSTSLNLAKHTILARV